MVALVDDEDYKRLNRYKWYAYKDRNRWYARRFVSVAMHRTVIKVPDSVKLDHKNGNGLDNQKVNLRRATNSQNSANRQIQSNNTSGYKGAQFDKRRNRWIARIRVSGRLLHLGTFPNAESAARAYDLKAKEVFGEFANLNFGGEV